MTTTHRNELAAVAEAAGIPAHPTVPGRINPPCVIVTEADPHLQPADRFGAYVIRYELTAIVAPGDNARQTTDLDTMVAALVPALDADSWRVETVGQYFTLATTNTQHLAVRITVTDEITF